MTDILKQLAAHFPPERISWRVGPTNQEKTKGIALAYIDARDVMERLDSVCGPWWSNDYIAMPNGTCCCRIGIMLEGQWVYRANGAMNLSDSDKADAKEMAEKGSYSDAFKRAAVLWGIGRYLYNIDSPWVEIRAQGRSYVIADSAYPILTRLLANMAKGIAPAPNGHDKEPEPKKQTPEGWANAAITIIKEIKARRELDDWVMSQGRALDALEQRAPAERKRVATMIDARFAALSELEAG